MGLIWLGHVVMDIFHGVSCGSDISVVTLIGLDGFARFVKRKGDTRTGAPDMFPCFLQFILVGGCHSRLFWFQKARGLLQLPGHPLRRSLKAELTLAGVEA